MIKIRQIKINIEEDSEELLKNKVCSILGITLNEILSFEISKKSLDARKKPLLYFIYEVIVSLENEDKILDNNSNINVLNFELKKYRPVFNGTKKILNPSIIGSGPCGLLCAYVLAKNGFKPMVYERGKCIEKRVEDVQKFWETNILNINSNVQFGEGGAGTFSDGKLNTLIKDKEQRGKYLLELFVECGAPNNILYESKPHIGTDLLRTVIINLRKKIIDLGGDFKYNSLLTDIDFKEEGINGFIINDNEYINTNCLILAIGHSARDTFEMLLKNNVEMESKPFAVGLRIMHNQCLINKSQIGLVSHPKLENQSYKLVHKSSSGRGVYSFCMCPGGYVVNSSSEKGRLVVNGMSNHARESEVANSAIVVTVDQKDFGYEVLDGMKFQQILEEKVYNLANGNVPVQKFKDFKNCVASTNFGSIYPKIKGNYEFANINSVLPKFLTESLIEGIDYFGNKIKGFNNDDSLLAGIESRTSSPIRILRNEKLCSKIKGLYPAGEGAGYAGGIVSSAIDGMKVAEEIGKLFKV